MSFKERTGKTRVGKMLQDMGDVAKPILGVLSKTGIPGSQILAQVSESIKTSTQLRQEEKQQLLEAINLDLADLANARDSAVDIQQSQFSSRMAKNVPYFLDLFIMLIWGKMTIFIIAKAFNLIQDGQIDWAPILGIYSGVTALATQVISFHRGSSQGSRIKDLINGKT